MGSTLTIENYYIGYYEILSTFSIFAFVFDNWFIGQLGMLMITVIFLIINGFFTIFKDGYGFALLLGAVCYYLINMFKWIVEYHVLGHPLF